MIHLLQEHLNAQPEVCFIYFKPDEQKTGGAHRTVSGVVRKIRMDERDIAMQDATIIPVDDILEMRGDAVFIAGIAGFPGREKGRERRFAPSRILQ